MSQRNPSYSATMQHLLDLKDCGLGESTIDEAIKTLRNDAIQRNKLDQQWNRHQYPDKHMRYVQSANYNECRARYELKPVSSKVLCLMEHVVHQSGLVQLTINTICECCSISRNSARSAINELIQYGMIAIYTPSKAQQAPIYQLNPKIANAGKPQAAQKAYEAFNEVAGHDAAINFIAFQKNKSDIVIVTQQYLNPVDKQIIKYNTLGYADQKEKPSARNANGSSNT